MTHLRVIPSDLKPAIINLVAGSLKIGQILVLPTDTIYGLSCLADNTSAIKRIFQLKKRDPKKPLIVLAGSLAMLKNYVFISKSQALFLKRVWFEGSRPTTVILRHRGHLPRELTGNSDGLAVRLPKSKFLIKILKKVGKPLVSTSLNLSGQANIPDLKSLLHHFPHKQQRPDLVVDFGKCRGLRPSRLIDLRDPLKPLVLRR